MELSMAHKFIHSNVAAHLQLNCGSQLFSELLIHLRDLYALKLILNFKYRYFLYLNAL